MLAFLLLSAVAAASAEPVKIGDIETLHHAVRNCLMCHLSSVTWFMCHVSCVICHMVHVSCVICHVSCVICHVSCVICHMSSVICHQSCGLCVVCHVSCVSCHVSCFMYLSCVPVCYVPFCLTFDKTVCLCLFSRICVAPVAKMIDLWFLGNTS